MTMDEIKQKLKEPEYDFLRNDEHLGKNIIFLTVGGSHAYGTNIEGSDLDIRGIALNSKEEILLNKDFGQIVDVETDTTIYSVKKAIYQLLDSNPNTLEILFVKPEQIIYMSDIGRALYENRHIFLSKDCFRSFICYAKDQLRRLDNKSMRTQSQEQQEIHILNSIKGMIHYFKKKYTSFEDDSINLYIDKSNQKDMETEIYMDIHLTHYPLRDYKGMWSEMHNVVKDYKKVGKRASNAILHQKVNKHSMHLVRLILNCITILKTGTYTTHCEEHLPLLMSIRNKKYMINDTECSEEFFALVNNLEADAKVAYENSILPDFPDIERAEKLLYDINELVILDSI